MHRMRFLSIIVVGVTLMACGGVTDNMGDSGTDAPPEAEPPICNGQYCSDYCIHPSTATCPTCAPAPDSGTCPNDSTLQDGCPAGPAMPPGKYCVFYPSPGPDYCSKTVPPMCSFGVTPPAPAEITCMPEACGA